MKAFLRNVSPRRAVVDLWNVLGAPSEFRGRALLMAALVTGGIFYLMTLQEGRGLPKPPTIIYFESWRADRSDKEIIAGNIAAQKKGDEEEAAEEQRAEDVRRDVQGRRRRNRHRHTEDVRRGHGRTRCRAQGREGA